MHRRSLLQLACCIGLCLLAGFIGGRVTYPEIATWYAGLAKPGWTPPNWAFPVVWNTLYVMMGVSLWLLWRSQHAQARLAIGLFFLQLALNAAWSPVFFGLHEIRWGVAIIMALAIAIAATIAIAWDVSRAAAWLLVPYLMWVIYAASLNSAIAVLNT
jgi:translocator protein